jgi:hypothetical protein
MGETMRAPQLGVLSLTALVAACHASSLPSPTAENRGRYAGIGVFNAGRLWAQMKSSPISADPAEARLADDEHVIVVVDSHTGEVRQCGDHSGYCIAMNPWTRPQGSNTALPVKLSKHAAEVDAQERATHDDMASARLPD